MSEIPPRYAAITVPVNVIVVIMNAHMKNIRYFPINSFVLDNGVVNMVFSMVAGAIFSIINLFVYTSKYAPYIPWCSPYLISSNEITNYSCNTATSLAILLATFAIGLTISYIYFTKKDVCL